MNSLFLSINLDTDLIKEALCLFKLNKNKINFDDFKKIYNHINENLDYQNFRKAKEVFCDSPQSSPINLRKSSNSKEKDGFSFGFFSSFFSSNKQKTPSQK